MPGVPPQSPNNGLAITGMVCGIVGLVTFWTVWLGIILGVLGIIFGILGRNRAAVLGGVGRGMGTAGLVCGAIAVGASIIWIVIVATVISQNVDEFEDFENFGAAAMSLARSIPR